MEKGVGASLQEARSRRKLSLAEVEAATKIRLRYLRALENEEWDELPGDTYARAFVRTYAGFLGLDADRLAEEVRRRRGSARPGEQLPRIDPRPQRASRRRGPRPRLSPRLIAALVSAALVAILVIVGFSGRDGSPAVRQEGGQGAARQRAAAGGGVGGAARKQLDERTVHALVLRATAEVWVCLLDSRGRPLVDGRILQAGEEEGPFRSGSFQLALGNGAVRMKVDGKQADIAASSSPVGFLIRGGSVRDLPEGERPTCT